MLLELYVSNLSPEITEEQLIELFSEKGAVQEVKILTNQRTGDPRDAAHVQMETTIAPSAILEHFNQYTFDDKQLFVSPYNAPKEVGKANQDERDYGDIVAKQLKETEKHPRFQILRLIQLCGKPAIENLLAETLKIEAEGGMMINDGSRRRTVGGIFFLLARRRFSFKVQRLVFYAAQKKKDKAGQPAQQQKNQQAGGKKEKGPKAPKGRSLPVVDEQELENARQKLAELQTAFEMASAQLEALKSAPPSERKTGLFSATREVANLQRQINDLMSQYPQLAV